MAIHISPFNIQRIGIEDALPLLERFHKYKGAGGTATYALGVIESNVVVAAFLWQPPAFGAAKSACPEAPHGVLALSRMVALPKSERRLKHISKPLKRIMRDHIDRVRWPVLITYSDEGAGHTGYVYQCSGWEATRRSVAKCYEDANGQRSSVYSSAGRTAGKGGLKFVGNTHIQRWEHWSCERGEAARRIESGGWKRELTGGKWRNGAAAGRWVRSSPTSEIVVPG